jgi:hypothetical protein
MDAAAEVIFYHLTLEMQQLLLKRWPPIKARMKNVLSLAKEEEECINSRRWTCCLPRWTY